MTLVPLDIRRVDGDILVKCLDPHYASPEPEEIQQFDLSKGILFQIDHTDPPSPNLTMPQLTRKVLQLDLVSITALALSSRLPDA